MTLELLEEIEQDENEESFSWMTAYSVLTRLRTPFELFLPFFRFCCEESLFEDPDCCFANRWTGELTPLSDIL